MIIHAVESPPILPLLSFRQDQLLVWAKSWNTSSRHDLPC